MAVSLIRGRVNGLGHVKSLGEGAREHGTWLGAES